jgi:hypothetical protein
VIDHTWKMVKSPSMQNARATLAALALVMVSWSGTASAEEAPDPIATARKEYGAGKEAYAAKRFAEAALHFEAAAAIRPHAVTLYTAALAWEAAAKPERAADAFSRSLDVAGLDGKQQENARARLNALEAALGTVIVKGPEGTHVQLEGLTETTTPARLHAPPGARVLVARFAGDKVTRKDVTLELNQVGNVEVKEEAAAPPAATDKPGEDEPKKPEAGPPSPPPKAGPTKFPMMKAAGIGAAGVGVGFLVGGTVLGLNALSAKDAYNAGPTRSSFDHANGLATWSTVAFVAGAVFTAGGVALLLIPDKEAGGRPGTATLQLSPLPFGGALSGAF